MGFLGNIGKNLDSVVGECMREALGSVGKDVLNAQAKIMAEMLKDFNAERFPNEMKLYLERSGLNDQSIGNLPDLQLVNILNSAKSPLRDLHDQLQIIDHLFDNCKTVVETVKE